MQRLKKFWWVGGLVLVLALAAWGVWYFLLRRSSPVAATAPAAVSSQPPAAFDRPERWTPGTLEIHLLDVQHGDAQLIISPSGETLLIDVGRVEYAEKVAAYLQAVLGEPTVDYFLMTHYHIDHLGAVPALFQKYHLNVRRAVLDRGGEYFEYDSVQYHDYFNLITDPKYGLQRKLIQEGDTIDLGPALSVKVLSAGDVKTGKASGVKMVGENDASIALWLTYGKMDYWTGADLSGVDSSKYANIEAAVIPKLPRQADLYKANHHGIKNNNSPAFLAAIHPSVSIISTEQELVSWDVVTQLEKLGDVYITDKIPAHTAAGDIVVKSKDGETFTVEGKSYQSK